MPNPYTISELRAIIAPIAQKHGVKRVTVFGSIARGEARPDSDVDLCIDVGAIKSLWKLGAFYADVEEALNCSLDLVTTGSKDKKFLSMIQPDEVTIYEQ